MPAGSPPSRSARLRGHPARRDGGARSARRMRPPQCGLLPSSSASQGGRDGGRATRSGRSRRRGMRRAAAPSARSSRAPARTPRFRAARRTPSSQPARRSPRCSTPVAAEVAADRRSRARRSQRLRHLRKVQRTMSKGGGVRVGDRRAFGVDRVDIPGRAEMRSPDKILNCTQIQRLADESTVWPVVPPHGLSNDDLHHSRSRVGQDPRSVRSAVVDPGRPRLLHVRLMGEVSPGAGEPAAPVASVLRPAPSM